MGMAIDAYGVNWLFGVAALAGLFLAGLLIIGLRLRSFGHQQN
jgi:hypothetical protein